MARHQKRGFGRRSGANRPKPLFRYRFVLPGSGFALVLWRSTSGEHRAANMGVSTETGVVIPKQALEQVVFDRGTTPVRGRQNTYADDAPLNPISTLLQNLSTLN